MKSSPPQPPSVSAVATNKWKSKQMEHANSLLLSVLNPEFFILPVLNVSALLIQSRMPILVSALPDSHGTMIAPNVLNLPLPPVLKAHIVRTINALNV